MKVTFTSQWRDSLLLLLFFWSPMSLLALSQIELSQLINNKNDVYIYCDKSHSEIADFMAEIITFDKNKNSSAWQLYEHIQKGFSIGRQDAVIEALESAEKTLEKSYHYLTNEKIKHIQKILNSIANAVANGKLIVNTQSSASSKKNIKIDLDNQLVRNNEIKVVRPVKFLKQIKFKEDVTFKDDVKFEDHVKFEDKVTFKKDATFEENVVIEGSLSVADETIDCDLTIGCNINMNNSSSANIGNIVKAGIPFIHNFGVQNTFLGMNTGNFTMNGQSNTASGAFALNANQSGFYNVASGVIALNSNQNGSVNTAIGSIALASNSSGDANTAVGFLTMVNNTSGSGNTAAGIESLFNNSSGDDNTAIGAGALDSSTTGSRNVALGVNAGTCLVTGDDNIYIAANGTMIESGIIRIGTLNTHNQSYIQGIFGEVTAIGGLSVEVDITGKLGTTVSSQLYKRNIHNMNMESENIHKLRPVTFYYNNDKMNSKQYGLIAEEVAQVFPSLIVHDKNGNPYSVRYQVLPVLLLNEVQKQQASIEALTERVAHLENARAA